PQPEAPASVRETRGGETMTGINLSEVAEQAGIQPKMPLTEARELAQHGGIPCPVCKAYPDSTFQQTMVYHYGMCGECLKKQAAHA
ncbi:MAG: hypothetical protein Q8K68_10585, partial [Nitrospirota bacterium]|nr:hypothetical protein [Nitrospirota bacterium]